MGAHACMRPHAWVRLALAPALYTLHINSASRVLHLTYHIQCDPSIPST